MGEVSTGDILYEKKARQRRAVASTTKLMTALVALPHSELNASYSATYYVAASIGRRSGCAGASG